jgi:hypothetical protein
VIPKFKVGDSVVCTKANVVNEDFLNEVGVVREDWVTYNGVDVRYVVSYCGHTQNCYEELDCMISEQEYKDSKDTKVTHTFKVGDKVKIVGNTVGHEHNIGEVVTLKSFDSIDRIWFTGEWYVAQEDIEPIVSTTYNPVSKPSHYNQGEGIECIEYIKQVLGPEGFIAYCRGNLMKYNHRAMYKGKPMQDLEKGQQYHSWAIETLKEIEESK